MRLRVVSTRLVVGVVVIVSKMITLVVASMSIVPTSTVAAAVVMIPVGMHVRAIRALPRVVVMVEIPLQMCCQGGFAFSTAEQVTVVTKGI